MLRWLNNVNRCRLFWNNSNRPNWHVKYYKLPEPPWGAAPNPTLAGRWGPADPSSTLLGVPVDTARGVSKVLQYYGQAAWTSRRRTNDRSHVQPHQTSEFTLQYRYNGTHQYCPPVNLIPLEYCVYLQVHSSMSVCFHRRIRRHEN